MQLTNKRYDSSGHDYELFLHNKTEVLKCTEDPDEKEYPTSAFSFTSLGDLDKLKDRDIIGMKYRQ